jgi:ribosome-binding ATPase YchF (GTP1/OBG family)
MEEKEVPSSLIPVELESGAQARNLQINPSHSDYEMFSSFRLLSSKPVLYVCNVDEASAATGNEYSKALIEYVQENRPQSCHVALSAILEFEVSRDLGRAHFFSVGHIGEPRTARRVYEDLWSHRSWDRKTYQRELQAARYNFFLTSSDFAPGLQTFYTMGQTEVRAWTVPFGSTAKYGLEASYFTHFSSGNVLAKFTPILKRALSKPRCGQLTMYSIQKMVGVFPAV